MNFHPNDTTSTSEPVESGDLLSPLPKQTDAPRDAERPSVEDWAPALARALAAIAEHPDKSNRLIAKEIGVDERTVRVARKKLAGDSAIDDSAVARIGVDGRTRHLPGHKPPPTPNSAPTAIPDLIQA